MKRSEVNTNQCVLWASDLWRYFQLTVFFFLLSNKTNKDERRWYPLQYVFFSISQVRTWKIEKRWLRWMFLQQKECNIKQSSCQPALQTRLQTSVWANFHRQTHPPAHREERKRVREAKREREREREREPSEGKVAHPDLQKSVESCCRLRIIMWMHFLFSFNIVHLPWLYKHLSVISQVTMDHRPEEVVVIHPFSNLNEFAAHMTLLSAFGLRFLLPLPTAAQNEDKKSSWLSEQLSFSARKWDYRPLWFRPKRAQLSLTSRAHLRNRAANETCTLAFAAPHTEQNWQGRVLGSLVAHGLPEQFKISTVGLLPAAWEYLCWSNACLCFVRLFKSDDCLDPAIIPWTQQKKYLFLFSRFVTLNDSCLPLHCFALACAMYNLIYGLRSIPLLCSMWRVLISTSDQKEWLKFAVTCEIWFFNKGNYTPWNVFANSGSRGKRSSSQLQIKCTQCASQT